jgi:hypothetical protein
MLLLLTTTRSQAKAFSDVVVCDLEPQIGSLAFQHTKSRTLRMAGINLPTDVWDLLNRVAFERSKNYGGGLLYLPCCYDWFSSTENMELTH